MAPGQAHASSSSSAGAGTLSLIAHAGGLVVVYSLYSVLQEKIMKTGYGSDNQHFTSASLLVLSNRCFSLTIGALFALLLPSKDGSPLSVRERLLPKWPMYFYAAVAAANFASTYCQYDALRFVGFTTQALAKCAKMVPVLIIGRVVYKKTYKEKEYVAGAVVLFGCFVYLTSGSAPVKSSKSHHVAASSTDNPWAPLIGCLLLCLYLGFDGLTSTTQEHYFGKSKKDTSPLTPSGPVLDQMVFVNACATIISALICVVNWGTTKESLFLALREPTLWFDITMLSATATFGLIILYDTIFKHGALTVATVMTCRQFWSIIMNAGIFGNFASVGFGGWTGVGFVAAGVWIKTSRQFDPPKAPANYIPVASTSGDENSEKEMASSESSVGSQLPLYDAAAVEAGRAASGEASTMVQQGRSKRAILAQYGIPLLCPLVFAAIASIFI